jgi:hypothetical protein
MAAFGREQPPRRDCPSGDKGEASGPTRSVPPERVRILVASLAVKGDQHLARVSVVVDLDRLMKYAPDQLPVSAQLFAETRSCVRLSVGRPTIIGPMARSGPSARWKDPPSLPHDPKQRERVLQSYENYRVHRRDVEDVINYMLGRDPEQLRPPSLSWDPLMEVLGNEGVFVTEDDLITTPFTFEFSDEFLGELAPEIGDDCPAAAASDDPPASA